MLMAISDVVSEAWWELKRARLRTYLALLGIVVGAIGFTILVGTFRLENALRGQQDTNVININTPTMGDYERSTFQRRPRLKRYEFLPSDAAAILRECPDVDRVEIEGRTGRVDIKGRKWYRGWLRSSNFTQSDYDRGVAAAARDGLDERMIWGRMFTPGELESGARVVVLDQSMCQQLWPPQERTLGNQQLGASWIRINGIRFDVVGVMPRAGTCATIPYMCMQDLFWDAVWYLRAVAKPGYRQAAARQVDQVLTRRLGDPGYSYIMLTGMSYEELKVYTFFGIVGALILFSAGLAVANKAYIDALERVQQFAVRRALGATRARVYAVVLTESAMLCAFGCFYGGIIGWMIFVTFSLEKWIERDVTLAIPPLMLVPVFLFVIALGVVGSLQGAAIAAKANPAEVLARKDIV